MGEGCACTTTTGEDDEGEGGWERERDKCPWREKVYIPPWRTGMQTARRMDFRHNGGEGWEGEGGGDEKKAVVVLPSLPFRVFTGLEWYGSRVQAA